MSRYSQLYIDYPDAIPDSARARYRIGKLLERMTEGVAAILSAELERELGVKVAVLYAQHWPRFCERCAMRDLLDTISIAYRLLLRRNQGETWLKETQRIFAEEHMAYAIDSNGVAHPAVDQEFQRNRSSTISGLQSARYANSLQAFERVSDELASDPPNGKGAWRAVFSAIEGLFRLMFPTATQLNAGAVDVHLTGLIQRLYGGDTVALRAANKQLAAFKDWVDSSHNYRHEPGSEEPIQPPIDLAILAVSNGASFLRWLISFDQANGGSKL